MLVDPTAGRRGLLRGDDHRYIVVALRAAGRRAEPYLAIGRLAIDDVGAVRGAKVDGEHAVLD